ncbi:amidohydrolase family protein [Haladaptatus sp. CMAA 1911]|uniref:amidohydrolase family protein n=1 Tax=unclassified Haladaptatus TaxID=2622732 RepID=UPI0037549D90
MIDSHFHLWTQDESTPEKRAERAEQIRGEMDALGVDKICLIGNVGTTIEECYESNRIVAKYVEEYPDLFYGWARVDPELGEEAVREFRRAVEEDGLLGLKHHFMPTTTSISDPAFFPLAEAAVDMDVPIIAHVMQRLDVDKENWDESEAHTEDVMALARRYPDLKLISAHIVAGGDAEYRIKNVEHQDNVILDISGSNCETDMIEMAAEYVGVDRLVHGTDTWLLPGVGKLDGIDLTPEEKTTIAYNMEDLLPDTVPNKYDEAELEERREQARIRFEERAQPREETIVTVNSGVGHWPFRSLDSSPDDLVSLMDRKGVDQSLVSSFESVLYRNCHEGNRELAESLRGYEDRLIPVATINPDYTAWRQDLAECVNDFGMRAVKLLPNYHDYDLDDPEAKALLDRCAELDVPVIITAVLEDQRGRHPRVLLRGYEDGGSRYFTDDHIDSLIDLLMSCPETDVIVADLWANVERVHRETCTKQKEGVRLKNSVRTGRTLFTIDDLFLYFTHQVAEIAETVGPDHLVVGPKLPLRIFDSYYNYVEHLPLSEAETDLVRSENVRSLLE